MRDSLRLSILRYLKLHEKMTLEQLDVLCKREERKLSNGEKRLRDLRARELRGKPNPFYNPRIGVIYNEKHTAIIAYTYDLSPYEKLDRSYKQNTLTPIGNKLKLI